MRDALIFQKYNYTYEMNIKNFLKQIFWISILKKEITDS